MLAFDELAARAYGRLRATLEQAGTLMGEPGCSLRSPRLCGEQLDSARLGKGEGRREVWIVNLEANVVEVYREPLLLANGIPGYRRRTDVMPGESLRPEAFPDLEIKLPVSIGL